MPACTQAASTARRQFALLGLVGHLQRAADAVERVGAAGLVLRLLEVRQHRIPVPADAAALAPFVVIAVMAADIDHAVDRAGAAQRLAARQIQPAVGHLRLRLGLELPVHRRIDIGLGIARGECGSTDCCRAARLPAAARDSGRIPPAAPATAQPADPAPVTMKSKASSMMFPSAGQPCVFQNHRRRLLIDHDARGVGIAADDTRHDGGISNAQAPIPCTLSRGSTTLFVPVPMAQVLVG